MTTDNKQQIFENLVQAYSPELYRFAFWQCKNQALAEDMLQECFARGWKALHKLEDEKAARAWLYTILRREIARHFKRKSSQELSLDGIEQDNLKPDTVAMDSVHIHYDCTLSDDINLRQAMDKIPYEYRDALMLQVLGGYSCEEIAEISDSTAGTIMTRLFRARQKLRQLLTKDSTSSARSQ